MEYNSDKIKNKINPKDSYSRIDHKKPDININLYRNAGNNLLSTNKKSQNQNFTIDSENNKVLFYSEEENKNYHNLANNVRIQNKILELYNKWISTLLTVIDNNKINNEYNDIGTPVQQNLEEIEKLKEENLKIKTKIINQKMNNENLEDILEKQIKDKTIKEYNEYLENEKYKKMFNENQNKLAQIEKEKEELKQKKLNMEKMAQKEQMKNKKIMDRIAFLKEKKFEKNMLNNIKLELEKEKKFQEEKKLKNFLEMKKIIQDSESRINQKRLEKQKQNELAKLYTHDSEITEKIKENERTKILNKIKSVGDYHQNDQTKKILEKMQKELEEEDKKLNEYFKTRKQIEDMKEEQEKKRKIKIRQELRNYLDNQIEEKKREKLFEKMLIREQGRIWDIDAKKYNMEQKMIEDKIKMNNIKNGEILRQQIENNFKRKMKKNSMSSAEYSLNKQEINKIIDSMETQKEKQKEKIN